MDYYLHISAGRFSDVEITMKLIVGLGKSGLSIAHYFLKKSIAFEVLEENGACENIALLKDVSISTANL